MNNNLSTSSNGVKQIKINNPAIGRSSIADIVQKNFNNTGIKKILDEQDKISKILQSSLNLPALKKAQESIKVIDESFKKVMSPLSDISQKIRLYDENLRKKILPISNIFALISQESLKLSQNPLFKFYSDVGKSETFEHEVFVRLFPDGFDKTKLQNNWDRISIFLKERWPDSLMKDDRAERMEQIYKAQDVGAYIAVCRAVYPEIEALLRDEIKSNHKVSYKSSIKGNPWGVDEDSAISEIGLFTASFVLELERCFESYNPKNNKSDSLENAKKIKNNRHFHCHGWSQKAEFIDALNALLMLDMTMRSIDELGAK